MNSNYRIGDLAEKILAVNIDVDGTITPILRRREASGRMVGVPERALQRASHVSQTEFVARVAHGHRGVVAAKPSRWYGAYIIAAIHLGQGRPFADEELSFDDRTVAARAIEANNSSAEEIWFRFADGKLAWKSENVSGEAVINQTYPELSVVLRLPPGNQGEISFASPLFTTADGEPASVLSVA